MKNMSTKEMQETITRLNCQYVALIHVLQNTPAADGKMILNSERHRMYEERFNIELRNEGLNAF